MDDEVFWLFVLVASMITLSMPTPVQPGFAMLAAAVSVLAGHAAIKDEVAQPSHDPHTVTDR
jgi:hypothetical protein